MTLTQEQLEWIVNEIVRRLRTATSDDSSRMPSAARMRLNERLITLETLHGRLDGVRTLEINVKAIMTPAAADRLRELGIDVLRQ